MKLPLDFLVEPYTTNTKLFGSLALGLVGLFGIRYTYRISYWFFAMCVATKLGWTVNFKKYNWAIITGATDGIGRGYARALAKRGVNLILVSRNFEKLEATADEIEKNHPEVQTRIVELDFGGDPAKVIPEIRTAIKGLDVGILVNNVGMSYEHPEYYDKLPNPDQTCTSMVRVNCMSQALVTRAVIGKLVEQNKGIIINISSISGMLPSPLMALYSACKAFNWFFAGSLHEEYKGTNLIIQCVQPFGVATKMLKVRNSSFFVPDPDVFAESALRTVGWFKNTHGCISHDLQGLIYFLPEVVTTKMQRNFAENVRERALKKKERESGKKTK